jgi:hypothetical protein
VIGECLSATAAPSSLSLIASPELHDSSDLAVLELLRSRQANAAGPRTDSPTAIFSVIVWSSSIARYS